MLDKILYVVGKSDFISYEMSKSAGGAAVPPSRHLCVKHSALLIKIDAELHVSAMLTF